MRRKAALLCGSIVVTALIMEIAVRLLLPYMDLKALTGRPGAVLNGMMADAFCAYTMSPQADAGKTVNSHGFVSTPEISVAKCPGRSRVLFLGGSSTAGQTHGSSQLPDDQTWPWLVAGQFGERVDFINGAMGGYTTFELIGRLWSRFRWYKPDVIVVYGGWNEMLYWGCLDDMSRWRTTPDGSWCVQVEFCRPTQWDSLLRRSQILTYARLGIAHIRQEYKYSIADREPVPWRPDDAMEVYRQNLRMICEEARLIGAELFVSRQATLLSSHPTEQQRQRCRGGAAITGLTDEQQLEALQRIYAVIDQEIDSEHIIDCTPLSGRPEYFQDFIHPSPLGARKIAEIVAARIAPAVPE